MPLAENLRKLRENRRLLQREAAEQIGMPIGTYVSYERGETETPPVSYAYAIAKFYEVTMEELLDLEPLSGIAVKAALRENERLRDRLAHYEAFAIAMPYIERAHRDMGRLLSTVDGDDELADEELTPAAEEQPAG